VNAPRGFTSATDEPALAYALRWRTRSVVPGAHRGFEQGRGGRFRQVVPFDLSPDPRRLDLRASARDPFGRLHVRQYEERATASVFVLTDTSASMAFGLRASAAQRAADVHAALARAAYAIGDAFGGAAGAESIQWRQPPRRRGYASCVGPLPARGRHLQGLVQEARGLGTRRRLVFVISDFEFPEIGTIELLETLEGHDVVPVVIGDHLEHDLPRWGLAELADLESGAKRLVFLRPSLHARWRRERAERRALLSGLFAARGRRPFFLDGALDPRSLADHLLDE
jgi:uncharacterized protein (DUF58 family)